MQSKITYSENGVDKAITGEIFKEDDFFIYILRDNQEFRYGKKFIIRIKPWKMQNKVKR